MALTWMDARIDGIAITPRIGKPVEIEALWVNALFILAELHERFRGAGDGAELRGRASLAAQRFAELFWNEATGCLLDCVDGETRDAAIRPNQVIALALPFPVLDEERSRRVLRVVEERLLTPVGLRSLAPGEPGYAPRYEGGPRERDAVYHQGTVWPWLLGPYLTALARLDGEAGRARGRTILAGLAPHLDEAGIGTVSEIFDAEPPHTARGCIAQAWSVAELLRAAVFDLGLGPEATR